VQPDTPASTRSTGTPPGLRDQLGATVNAAKRLGHAHIDLARAEVGQIAGEVGRMVALIGVALGLLFATAILIAVGLPLFLAEWLLGSMGWGVLLGTFLLIDLAIVTVLVAIGASGGRLFLGLLIGVVVAAAIGIALASWTDIPRTIDAALGIWAGLIIWPIITGIGVARGGFDGEALKQRFVPDQTIELTKETIEWLRARTPLAPKS
jgi:HAMP domain-containing protein